VTPPHAEPAKVIDIMEALKQSLAIAKKPPASVEALEAEAPKQKTAAKKQRTARG
jgi:non-homologous end joining protein Ku